MYGSYYKSQIKINDSKSFTPYLLYKDARQVTLELFVMLYGTFFNHFSLHLSLLFLYFTASVSRIAKFLHMHGTPIVTTGGYSFDFEKAKQSCADEYFMLTRVGLVSYQTIAEMMVSLMFK